MGLINGGLDVSIGYSYRDRASKRYIKIFYLLLRVAKKCDFTTLSVQRVSTIPFN
jgi:KaiC/GvpD/RAD55 family RecA-like ATPase